MAPAMNPQAAPIPNVRALRLNSGLTLITE
jgi:hypothetical protein